MIDLAERCRLVAATCRARAGADWPETRARLGRVVQALRS